MKQYWITPIKLPFRLVTCSRNLRILQDVLARLSATVRKELQIPLSLLVARMLAGSFHVQSLA